MALRVGYEKLNAETGWRPTVSWEEGIRRTIAWYAANRDSWVGRVDWMQGEAGTVARRRPSRLPPAEVRALVTGGGRLPRLVPGRAAQ